AGGNEQGLQNALCLADALGRRLESRVELMVAGNVPPAMRTEIERAYDGRLWIHWAGVLPREDIPRLDRSAHLMFSADLNAACPNSVIEALACGLPVIGYATGSLPELIDEDAGRVVPYGANYWKLEPPETDSLVNAAVEIIAQQESFRQAARRRAEAAFGLDRVIDQYLDVLLG
ncbi:MAG TPA: glycosyltransferase, partial [Anaerolineaceae bacterium]|nr:glycosyltransferase [Anaerolineaceae bacterium]